MNHYKSLGVKSFVILISIVIYVFLVFHCVGSVKERGKCDTTSLSKKKEFDVPSEMLFELNVNYYHSGLAFLSTNMFFQGIFNIIALLILRGDNRIYFPGFNNGISVNQYYLVAPIVLLVLWLQFGFQFNTVIELREKTWNLICYGDYTIYDIIYDVKLMSAMQLFQDSLLLDGWFYLNKTEHVLRFYEIPIILALSLTYCLLFGLTHVNIIAIPVMFIKNSEYKILLASFISLSIIALIGSNVAFYSQHINCLQYIIAYLAAVSALVIWYLKSS